MPPIRFAVNVAPRFPFALQGASRDVAIAPDAAFVVYRAGTQPIEMMVWGLNELEATAISGVGDFRDPFVSPDGDTVEQLIEDPHQQVPTSVSRDGSVVILNTGSTNNDDIGVLTLGDSAGGASTVRSVHTLVSGPGRQASGALSPDRRWQAYESDQSGSLQVYVRPFPNSGRSQISTDGGTRPCGRQLVTSCSTLGIID